MVLAIAKRILDPVALLSFAFAPAIIIVESTAKREKVFEKGFGLMIISFGQCLTVIRLQEFCGYLQNTLQSGQIQAILFKEHYLK